MKKTLLQYITSMKESVLSPMFDNNTAASQFMQDIRNYGIAAFDKLHADTQFKIVSIYYSVYRHQ